VDSRIFPTAQVQTLTLLPGTFAFQAGARAFNLSVSAQGQLDHDVSLDGRLSGRGTNALVLHAS
jgi:hypothetical protein